MNYKAKLDVYREIQKELEEKRKSQQAENLKHKSFFTEDYIAIEYNAQGWLEVDWKGYQTEGSVIGGCEKILEAMKFFNTAKILNDNSNVVGIWTPAAQWVGSNWFPRMIDAGLKKFAWVYSPSVLSQVSTDESLKHSPQTEVIKTFYTIESAKEWLSDKTSTS